MIPFVYVDGMLTVVIKTLPYTINSSHKNFNKIKGALKSDDEDKVYNLIHDISTVKFDDIVEDLAGKNERLVFKGNKIYYDNEEVHNSIVSRIFEFRESGLPYEPLFKFLNNLMQNPSYNSRNQLYKFLEYNCLVITDDGHFYGYKGIRHDYTDVHTSSISNRPGCLITMDRSKIDDNPNTACGAGLHVGTYKYASGFGQRTVLVKVNPRDAVSVPHDSSCQKLRTCQYLVVADCTNKLDGVLYSGDKVEPVKTKTQTFDWIDEDVYSADDVKSNKSSKPLKIRITKFNNYWYLVDCNTAGTIGTPHATRQQARNAKKDLLKK